MNKMYISNRKPLSRFIIALLCSALFFGISGCSDNKPKDEIPEYITDDFRQNFPDKFKSLPNEKLNFPPEAPLDDEDFWKEPRVQFVWNKQKVNSTDKDYSDYVFSMKLDGSDIRLVAGPEELIPEGSGKIYDASRSPNSRYLAFYKGFYYLYDLKNKQRIRITNVRSGGNPILWSSDSNTVFFQGKRGMKQYDIPSKTLKPLLKHGKDDFFPWPRFTLDNGASLVYLDREIYKLDTDGNITEKIPLPECNKKRAGYWFVNDWMRLYACDTERFIFSVKDKRIIPLGKDVSHFWNRNNHPAFNPYDLDAYHYNDDGLLSKINVVTRNANILINKDIKVRSFSIINFPPMRYQIK